jgi:predicted metal-dependent hydrolase
VDPAVPEPALDAEEQQAFAKGVAEFNAGFYFECHDTLEELWSGVRGPSRDFFQGLIQVSVAFHHLTRGNLAGAESLLQRALGRLSKYPDRYFGFDLAGLRAELLAWLSRVRAGEVGRLAPADLPKWPAS